MTRCNYCSFQLYKKRAEEHGNKIVLRPSGFMGGTLVFEIGKNETVPKYKEPSDKLPNGDEWYEKHNVSWMMEIGDSCCC